MQELTRFKPVPAGCIFDADSFSRSAVAASSMLLLAVQTGLYDSDEPADAASIELKNSQRASAYAPAFFR